MFHNPADFPFPVDMDQYLSNTETLFFGSSFFPEYTFDTDYTFDTFPLVSPLPSPTEVPGTFPLAPSPSPEFSPKIEPSSPTSISEQEPTPQRLTRRGRPRVNRSFSDNSSSGKGRIAHKQVERKYREGLNAELDRLRRSIPTLPRIDESKFGHVRLSKTMVLASAIKYIHKIEQERHVALQELEGLREMRAANVRRQRAVQ